MMRCFRYAALLLAGLALHAAAAAQEPTTATATTVQPQVKIGTTLGTITLELDAEKAPLSTANFLRYTQEGFYTGTIFHRVIADFMIQGGQYTPDMNLKQEGLHAPVRNEWTNGLKNTRGTIAMARLGNQPDSATAQFFINVVDNPMLDKPNDGAGYAVFGKVVEGMDVVDAIRNTKVVRHPAYPAAQPVVPEVSVVIQSTVVSNGFDAAGFVEQVRREQADAVARAEADAKAAVAGEMAVVNAYVERIEKETGTTVTRTNSGLMYFVLKPGTGPKPARRDQVSMHYVGTYLDGEKFDSSVDRGQPFTVNQGQVIKGWQETVPDMHVGEKRKIIVPPAMAYGEKPDNKGWMVFDMELLEIVK